MEGEQSSALWELQSMDCPLKFVTFSLSSTLLLCTHHSLCVHGTARSCGHKQLSNTADAFDTCTYEVINGVGWVVHIDIK